MYLYYCPAKHISTTKLCNSIYSMQTHALNYKTTNITQALLDHANLTYMCMCM